MAEHPFVALVTPMAHGLLITPLSGAHPEHPIAPGGPPPSVGEPTFPTPPIAPGGPPPTVGGGPITPPGVWPPPGHPDDDLPVPPPTVDNTLPEGKPPSGGLVLIWIPGVGLKWFNLGVGIDNSLPTPPPSVNPTPPDQPPPTVGGGPVTPPPVATAPDQPPPATPTPTPTGF